MDNRTVGPATRLSMSAYYHGMQLFWREGRSASEIERHENQE